MFRFDGRWTDEICWNLVWGEMYQFFGNPVPGLDGNMVFSSSILEFC